MNAERLLAHYEKITDAPDAIARLRRFILDLAVRGKLVPQDANDEPASELLKRIAAEKARLIEEGELKADRSEKDRPGKSQSFALPMGWTWASLKDLCLSITDGDHLPPPKAVDGVPFLVISDVRSKIINYDSERRVPRSYYAALDAIRRPRAGDLLYTLVGSFGIPVPVVSATEFCVQRHIGILRPSTELGTSFLTRFMESGFAFEQADGCATGIAQRTIPLAGLRGFKMPVPPLAEQQRIVAKVDELMGLCDRLEAARAGREAVRDRLAAASLVRLNAPDPETFQADVRFALNALPALTTRPDQIKTLRQTILNLAVRGKLVPQDASDEPAWELLKRIAKEKAQASRREEVETEIDNEEDFGDLPPNWRAVPLIALGSWAIGSGFPKNEQGSESGPYFFLKVSDMNLPGNEKYIITSNNFIDDDAARRMRAKIHPPGTVIFPKIGGAIATNKRRILTRGSAIDNNCLGITFASAVDIEWAHLLLTTLDFTRYQAGTAVPALQQGVLERIPVRLPPLAEQHRIVAKVDALITLCDRLEASLTATAATRRRLLDALLAEALTPVAEDRDLEAAE